MAVDHTLGSSAGDAAAAFKTRLRADLGAAIKQKDAAAVAALRAMIAALDNAQAVPPEAGHVRYQPRDFADGSAEVPRLRLAHADIARLVDAEVAARESAAAQMLAHGKAERAEALRREAAVLRAYAGDAAPPSATP